MYGSVMQLIRSLASIEKRSLLAKGLQVLILNYLIDCEDDEARNKGNFDFN